MTSHLPLQGQHKRLQVLDGLRGTAALVVLVWHINGLHRWAPASSYMAVDLFFIMSGFVIATAYDQHLQDHEISALQFIVLRVLRLYPLYIIGTLMSVSLIILSILRYGVADFNLNASHAIPYAITMLPALSENANNPLYPLNVPAWSLLFEIIINVLYAISFRFWTPSSSYMHCRSINCLYGLLFALAR